MNDIKLSPQENKIVNYLVSKNGNTVYLEELVQFAKDPQNIKRKTVLRWVSDIKKKYTDASLPLPYQVTFDSLANKTQSAVQSLTQVKKTPGGNMMRVPSPAQTIASPPHPAHVDFTLDYNTRRVKTKLGSFQLNENEWNVFKYIHNNVGRLISLSELRDQVVFPQYGSKLPARWFDSIMRIIHNLRRQVNGLNTRLHTVKGSETNYLFQ